MNRTPDPNIADMGGAAALPRKSGELVFHDPWERRVFAMAVALCEQGHYGWDDFRDHLITEIAAVDRAAGAGPTPPQPGYYEHWLASFAKLLVEKGLCTQAEVEAKTAQ